MDNKGDALRAIGLTLQSLSNRPETRRLAQQQLSSIGEQRAEERQEIHDIEAQKNKLVAENLQGLEKRLVDQLGKTSDQDQRSKLLSDIAKIRQKLPEFTGVDTNAGLKAESLFGNIRPVKEKAGIGSVSPNDFTGESLDAFRESGSFGDLSRIPLNEKTFAPTDLAKMQTRRDQLSDSLSKLSPDDPRKLRIEQTIDEIQARINKSTAITGRTETDERIDALGVGEAGDLRNSEVSTRNFLGTMNDTLKLIKDTPDINTLTAKGAAVFNDLKAEVRAVSSSLGIDFDDNALDDANYDSALDDLGIESQRIRSVVVSLAFQAAAASGQSGKSVSDKDVLRFVREIGANASDSKAFAAVLKDVGRRTVRNFKNNFEVRAGKPFDKTLPFEDVLGNDELDDSKKTRLEELREKQGAS